MKNTQSTSITLAGILTLVLLALSISIAVPILWRGFYELHIDWYQIPERSGFTEPEILEAFHEMMDYCVLGRPFGTGSLAWSPEGYAHFRDCARLFHVDFAAILMSLLAGCVLLVLRHYGLRPRRLCGRGVLFWSGLSLGGGFLLLTGLVALDFQRAFTLFHVLLFPGQDNWLFDPSTDEIIRILPVEYFRNCGALIVAVLLSLSILMMLVDFLPVRRKTR